MVPMYVSVLMRARMTWTMRAKLRAAKGRKKVAVTAGFVSGFVGVSWKGSYG